jgi:hypothetical protein
MSETFANIAVGVSLLASGLLLSPLGARGVPHTYQNRP